MTETEWIYPFMSGLFILYSIIERFKLKESLSIIAKHTFDIVESRNNDEKELSTKLVSALIETRYRGKEIEKDNKPKAPMEIKLDKLLIGQGDLMERIGKMDMKLMVLEHRVTELEPKEAPNEPIAIATP